MTINTFIRFLCLGGVDSKLREKLQNQQNRGADSFFNITSTSLREGLNWNKLSIIKPKLS